MSSRRGAEEGLAGAVDLLDSPDLSQAVLPTQRSGARAAWPNSRDDRFGGAGRAATRTGRRAAVPGPAAPEPAASSPTALATPPGGLSDLVVLLGLPSQRTAGDRWQPAAPVPAPQAFTPWRVPAQPTVTDELDVLPARRRRRGATTEQTAQPAAPELAELLSGPTTSDAPMAPAPGTRRARRAATGPVDAAPVTAAPARPGSRRALREAEAQGRLAPAFPVAAAAPVSPAGETDTELLTRLEALLRAPETSVAPLTPQPVEQAAPAEADDSVDWAGLDLRTDPRLGRVGWARHTPAEPAPAVAEALEVEAEPAPLSEPTLFAEPEAAAAFVPRRGKASHRLPRRARAALPQVAVVGVLGVATLVAPLVGTHLRAEAGTAHGGAGSSTSQAVAAAGIAGASDLLAERTAESLSRSSARADAALKATAQGAADAQREQDRIAQAAAEKAEADRQAAEQAQALAAEQAHRAAVAALVGDCSGQRPNTAGTKNGRLSSSQLCDLVSLSGSHQLRADAAVAYAELALAYKEHFGTDLVITDSYRSYAEQVAVRRKKPSLAAVPGTSEHGWGLALDLGGGVEDSDEHYQWLIANAPKYGWDHPAWARKGGGGPYEPWHWEFVAGE